MKKLLFWIIYPIDRKLEQWISEFLDYRKGRMGK